MNATAKSTMEGIPEVAIGYGISDEFRYLYIPPELLLLLLLLLLFFFFYFFILYPVSFDTKADKNGFFLVLSLDGRVSFLSGEKGKIYIYIYIVIFFLHFSPSAHINERKYGRKIGGGERGKKSNYFMWE